MEKLAKGNPAQRSPQELSNDPKYKVMTDYAPGNYYPSASEIIVKHKGSNTYWKTVYRVGEDDSDFGLSASWRQVFPKKITITQYATKDE